MLSFGWEEWWVMPPSLCNIRWAVAASSSSSLPWPCRGQEKSRRGKKGFTRTTTRIQRKTKRVTRERSIREM